MGLPCVATSPCPLQSPPPASCSPRSCWQLWEGARTGNAHTAACPSLKDGHMQVPGASGLSQSDEFLRQHPQRVSSTQQIFPATLSGGTGAPTQKQTLTLIHRYGRNVFRCWRHADDAAARNLPLHLRQVPEEAGDPGGQVRSIAHQQAELEPQGRGGGEQTREQNSQPVVSRRAAPVSFVPSVPTAFPLNAAALKSPIHTQSGQLPFTGGRRKQVYGCTNTLLSLRLLEFRRGGNGSFLASTCSAEPSPPSRPAAEAPTAAQSEQPQHVQQQQKPPGPPAPSLAAGTQRPRGLAGRGCSCRSACPWARHAGAWGARRETAGMLRRARAWHSSQMGCLGNKAFPFNG